MASSSAWGRVAERAWVVQRRLEGWWYGGGAAEARAAIDLTALGVAAVGTWALVRHDYIALVIGGPNVLGSLAALALIVGYWLGGGGPRKFAARVASLDEALPEDE